MDDPITEGSVRLLADSSKSNVQVFFGVRAYREDLDDVVARLEHPGLAVTIQDEGPGIVDRRTTRAPRFRRLVPDARQAGSSQGGR
jgi:hypothetical protein